MKLEQIEETEFLALVGIVTCPRCGEDIEIWSERSQAACESCNYKLFKKEHIIH